MGGGKRIGKLVEWDNPEKKYCGRRGHNCSMVRGEGERGGKVCDDPFKAFGKGKGKAGKGWRGSIYGGARYPRAVLGRADGQENAARN